MSHESRNLKGSFNALIHHLWPPPSPSSLMLKFPVHGGGGWLCSALGEERGPLRLRLPFLLHKFSCYSK